MIQTSNPPQTTILLDSAETMDIFSRPRPDLRRTTFSIQPLHFHDHLSTYPSTPEPRSFFERVLLRLTRGLGKWLFRTQIRTARCNWLSKSNMRSSDGLTIFVHDIKFQHKIWRWTSPSVYIFCVICTQTISPTQSLQYLEHTFWYCIPANRPAPEMEHSYIFEKQLTVLSRHLNLICVSLAAQRR